MDVKRKLTLCCVVLASACSSSNSSSLPDTYQAICGITAPAEGLPVDSCKVISDTIDRFLTDDNTRRGAYVMQIVKNYHQTNPQGRSAARELFVEEFGVDESALDPETHQIKGNRNQLMETMYQKLGVDYGGDRRAFARLVESKLNSPEARSFIDERIAHYMK